MTKKALVLVANGSEEVECIGVVDFLRRAEVEVTLATVEEQLLVTCSRGTMLQAERRLEGLQASSFDALVIPGGGGGAETLGKSQEVLRMAREVRERKGALLCAICAAPAVVLARNGLLDDVDATCYPALKAELPRFRDERVVVDKEVITSQGVGTTLEFALAIIEALLGKEKRDEVAKAAIVHQ